ncbi:hypothetical protein C8Q79DRAFT_923550 [Trametes meyenii]|nr:hypothetical protein C8Q79DRAFT_923550 [Trametes meyenii]
MYGRLLLNQSAEPNDPIYRDVQKHPKGPVDAVVHVRSDPERRLYTFAPSTSGCPAAGNAEAVQQPAPHSMKVTAAHRVLFSGDILASIFKPFETDRFWNRANQPDLFHFMLVCKFFFFHASAALWSTISVEQGENPLWVVLGIKGRMYDSASEGQLGQLRDLTLLSEALRDPVGRNNLIYYCGLVRSLLLDTGVVTPEITPILCQLPPDDLPLFCGLQRLYWTESPFGSSDLLHVIGRCLERLTVIVGQNYFGANGIETAYTHWVQQLIAKVSLLSPSLRYLSLISNGLGVTIPGLNHKNYFSGLHGAPVCVYNKDAQGRYHANPAPTAERTFNVLRELSIQADYGSPSIMKNAGIIAPHLEDTLRVIRISMDHFIVPEGERPVLAQYISSILLLHRLAFVSITLTNIFPGIHFGTADFLRLAEAWPFIEHLKLGFRPHMGTLPPNVASLGPFASGCPLLVHLTLPAMQSLQTSGALKIERSPSSKLSSLNMGRVYLNTQSGSMLSKEDVALAVCKAFPNAVYVPSDSHIAKIAGN